MNTPRPEWTPSRLNAGGYGVRVIEAPSFKSLVKMVERDLSDAPRFTADCENLIVSDGTVTPDGSLSIEPENWIKRHYRRAIMRGAGVYRWGLWAFLGARPTLKFKRPEVGYRIEPYNVTVKSHYLKYRLGEAGWHPFWIEGSETSTGYYVALPTIQTGKFDSSGLNWAEKFWTKRDFTHALMQSSGVYQAGLWAMLAGKRTAQPVKPEQVAALGVNDLSTFKRIDRAAHGRVRHSVRWRTPVKVRVHKAFSCLMRVSLLGIEGCIRNPRLSSGRPKSRTRRSWARGQVALRVFVRRHAALVRLFPKPNYLTDPNDDKSWDKAKEAGKYYVLSCLKHDLQTPIEGENALRRAVRKIGEREAPGAALYAALTGKRTGLAVALTVVRRVKARRTLVPLLAQIVKRGDLYRAYLARLVKPQRAPRWIPRPLYSRAIPPAAPLAPPAL